MPTTDTRHKRFRRHAFKLLACATLAASGASLHAQPAAPAVNGTLAKIQAAKVINVGVRSNAAPFASVDAAGKPSGFTWELCKAVVRSLSESLKTPLEIKVVPVTVPVPLEEMKDGRIDLNCGSTTHTSERQASVEFSYTFFVSGIVAGYRASDVGYASPTQFGRVGVLKGSTAAKAVSTRVKNMSQSNFKELIAFDSYNDGLQMLKANKIDTLVADSSLLPPDNEVAVRRQQMTVEPYALTMRKGDTAFVKAVDQALAAIMKSPLMDSLATQSKLRVGFMTRDAWVYPGKTPAPPQF